MDYLSEQTIVSRLERLHKACASDKKRFQMNPLGPGYLTRQERWWQVIDAYKNEYRRRIEKRNGMYLRQI